MTVDLAPCGGTCADDCPGRCAASGRRGLRSHRWGDLSARDFARLDTSALVAVLPVGAVEQHGPHMPVSVDATVNAGIVEAALARMPADFPALFLPMTAVGKSDEHAAFAGTLTLSAETLAAVWMDLCRSVARAGVRRVLFFNSHGGQPQVIEIVARRARIELGLIAVWASWPALVDLSDLFGDHERRHGIHAGEVETSVMLHLRPDLVDMDEARDFVPMSVALEAAGGLLTPEGAIGFGWQAQDLHPTGAAGNAAAADAARGKTVIDRAATGLLALIEEVSRLPLTVLGAGTIYAERTTP